MASEHIEPAFAYIMGQHFKKFKEALGTGIRWELEEVLKNWWIAMQSMGTILITLGGNHPHASIALMNHKMEVAKIVKEHLGFNPISEKREHWELDWK